jgi:hypothetical protein
MAIATFDELRYTARHDADDRARLAKSIGGKNLFLSHSLADLPHLKYAVDLLEQNGARVYIDVKDASVANVSAADAAKRLRSAIRETRRLVVLVTENTHTSRWIPWEMGLADAVTSVGADRIALLPLRSSSSASELWAKQEYFELLHGSNASSPVRDRRGSFICPMEEFATCRTGWTSRSQPEA